MREFSDAEINTMIFLAGMAWAYIWSWLMKKAELWTKTKTGLRWKCRECNLTFTSDRVEVTDWYKGYHKRTEHANA